MSCDITSCCIILNRIASAHYILHRWQVPDPMRPPLIARLSDAIIDEAADWDVAEADGVIVKIREMLEREALKRILAEYGVQISREMLQVGDQLRAAAAGKQRRGSLQLQRKKSQSTEDEKIDASEFESDSLLNVSEFTESELPASGGDHDDKDTFDNLRSDEAFYSARSDLFFSTGPQKGRLLRGSLEDLPHAQKRVVRVYLCSNFSGECLPIVYTIFRCILVQVSVFQLIK